MKIENEINIMDLSPYDDSLPTRLLQEALDFRVNEAELTTKKVYENVVKRAGFHSVVPDEGTEKMHLVVDLSDDMLQNYADGTIKLAKEKGNLVAQLKENGRYGSKLPVKAETYLDGADPLQVQNALQLQAIQEALVTISEQIQAIDENVKQVLIGQQNDRLGLYYSGVSQFIEAYSIDDEGLKKQLLAQAVKTLSDSVFQHVLSIHADITYLKRSEYEKDKKHKFNLVNERIHNINRAFMAIHQASIMKAGVYCYCGEIKAMTTTLREYERFIEGTIVSNAEMLSQCDPNDNGKSTGIWKKRAKFQLSADQLLREIKTNDSMVLYLDNGEGVIE